MDIAKRIRYLLVQKALLLSNVEAMAVVDDVTFINLGRVIAELHLLRKHEVRMTVNDFDEN